MNFIKFYRKIAIENNCDKRILITLAIDTPPKWISDAFYVCKKKIFRRSVHEFFVIIDLVSYPTVDLTMPEWWTDIQELYQTLSWISARCSLTCSPPRDSSLCIYRRGYLRAPPRLLITISTTIFYQENGGRYSENKQQNVSA